MGYKNQAAELQGNITVCSATHTAQVNAYSNRQILKRVTYTTERLF